MKRYTMKAQAEVWFEVAAESPADALMTALVVMERVADWDGFAAETVAEANECGQSAPVTLSFAVTPDGEISIADTEPAV